MKITFREATLLDVETLIALQNQSFLADRERFGFSTGYGHTPEGMAGLLLTSQGYLILEGEVPVGNILCRQVGPEAHHLISLCVLPQYQGRGIGGQALAFLDARYPAARRWTLETPAEQERNLHFYQKHGYRPTDTYRDGGLAVCKMERRR